MTKCCCFSVIYVLTLKFLNKTYKIDTRTTQFKQVFIFHNFIFSITKKLQTYHFRPILPGVRCWAMKIVGCVGEEPRKKCEADSKPSMSTKKVFPWKKYRPCNRLARLVFLWNNILAKIRREAVSKPSLSTKKVFPWKKYRPCNRLARLVFSLK